MIARANFRTPAAAVRLNFSSSSTYIPTHHSLIISILACPCMSSSAVQQVTLFTVRRLWAVAVCCGRVSKASLSAVQQVTLFAGSVTLLFVFGCGCLWRWGKQSAPFRGAAGGTHLCCGFHENYAALQLFLYSPNLLKAVLSSVRHGANHPLS